MTGILTEPHIFLQQQDSQLGEIIQQISLPEIDSSEDVFYDLLTCILEQQIHYRSSGVYLRKFNELTDGLWPTAELVLTLDAHDFALKKIASNKFQRLQVLAQCWIDRGYEQVDWQQLGDEAIRARLSDIKGIGPWTVNMILLFTLGRPDIFDPNDYQLKKVMASVYGLSPEGRLISEMKEISEKWSPFKSTAVRYLLAWQSLSKKRR